MKRQLVTLGGVAGALLMICGCGGSADLPAPSPAPAPSSPAEPATTSGETESGTTTQAANAAPEVVKEGWGTLKGRFVLSGSLPGPSPLQITKDSEVCGKHNLVDESVVVNAANKGIANVVVQLYLGRGDKAPDAHESYSDALQTPVILDNDMCRFAPHVQVVRPDQPLLIKNSDTVGHNTKIDTVDNPAFNQTIPAGAEIELQFAGVERRPASVSCSIHPWMRGWLIIQDTPYAVVTNADGEFEIPNLPAGNWTFQVWQEKAGMVSQATVAGKAANWSRGRFEATIQGDETNDLGTIELAADLFQD